ncbi:MAG TPA: hypothetical protein VFQ82_03905 [Stellaceae bacterium]|nr:hypothetical protein [Stellaceae bacterium]
MTVPFENARSKQHMDSWFVRFKTVADIGGFVTSRTTAALRLPITGHRQRFLPLRVIKENPGHPTIGNPSFSPTESG